MKHKFMMTSFMYPLDENNRTRIFGNLYFDNPRTTEEINYVAEYLKKANLSERPSFPDRPGLIPEGFITLMTIYDEFYKNNIDDIVVRDFCEKNRRYKNIYKKLAKMMVVIRSDNLVVESENDIYFTLMKNQDEDKIQLIKEKNVPSIIHDEDKINGYFSFVAFMLDGGLNNNIIKNELNKINYWKQEVFVRWLVMSHIKKSHRAKDSYPYGVFNLIEPRIIRLSNAVGERYDDKKFLFMCKKINYILDLYNIDIEMCFVELIGLLEMLITHNPDNGRFNVEDSITKQFVGKLTLILYENDKKIVQEKVEKELKFAYGIRSAIAHGDFNELEKGFKKLFNFYDLKSEKNRAFYKGDKSAFTKLVDQTIRWVRIVINLYLKDEKRLDIIKKM
ncbi:MAG: hypothetical protein IJD89_03335 [Clostridia bacterium]|nr:hypothetical protein [Clostridia bacterium]